MSRRWRDLVLGFILAITTLEACQSRLAPISQRPLAPGRSTKDKTTSNGPEEVLLKQLDYQVVPKTPLHAYGSLYQPKNRRNQLFADQPVAEPNTYLDVAVMMNRQPGAKSQGEKEAVTSSPAPLVAGAAEGAKEPTVPDSDLAALLPKQFPHLDGGATNPAVLKTLKFNVLHRLDNGDAILGLRRVTENDNETKVVEIRARLASAALMREKSEFTTRDLSEVEIKEVNQGELTVRRSSGWEDEYTLIMSGFTEAKSRLAQDLDERQKLIDQSKVQLQTKVESFSKERQQVAKERERLSKEKAQLDKKMQDLSTEVDEQKKAIEALKPQEPKPGNEREGTKK